MKLAIVYHVYKNHLTLEESIKSFMKQNDNDFEFILVNDGAANKTAKVLQKLDLSKFKHLKYFSFSQNIGHSFSFNTALNTLDADYVYYGGSNVFVKPNFIQQVKLLLNKHKPDALSIINIRNTKQAQVFARVDMQFKKCIGQSTRDKIFSVKLLKNNNITMDETYYSPLVFIYQVLLCFKKWVIYDCDLLDFKPSASFTYNLYDVFQQNQYLIETYSTTKFWKANQQFIEFLMVLFILNIFLPRIFIQYKDKHIERIAVDKSRNWLEKYIPDWKSNNLLKSNLILNPKNLTYLHKFKFKSKYIISAVKNKVF